MSVVAVRECVREECGRSALRVCFFEEHLAVVAEFAESLARRLGANTEAVLLAAWLHDLAAVRDLAALPEHARLGAELARGLLPVYGYEGAVIETVARAIAAHSSPLPLGGGTLEAVCLSQADAAAQILRPAYWLYFVFTVRKCGFEEGTRWVAELYRARWIALIEPARELVGSRYRDALAFLEAPRRDNECSAHHY